MPLTAALSSYGCNVLHSKAGRVCISRASKSKPASSGDLRCPFSALRPSICKSIACQQCVVPHQGCLDMFLWMLPCHAVCEQAEHRANYHICAIYPSSGCSIAKSCPIEVLVCCNLLASGLDSPGQSHGDDRQVPGRPKAVPGVTRQIRRPSKLLPGRSPGESSASTGGPPALLTI